MSIISAVGKCSLGQLHELCKVLSQWCHGEAFTQDLSQEAMDGGDSMSVAVPEEEKEPGFIKKILLIPCMTKSLMYGISGGLGIGLGHFLFTSNVSRATNFGLGGYVVVLFGTWAVCRYELAHARARYIQVQNALQSREGNSNIKLIDPKDV